MEERRTLIVVTIILFSLVVLFGVTTYFTRREADAPWTGKRLMARDGTTREGARILTTTERPASGAQPVAQTSKKKPLPVQSLSPDRPGIQTQAKPPAQIRQAILSGETAALEDLLRVATETEKIQLLDDVAKTQQELTTEAAHSAEAAVIRVLGEEAGNELRLLVLAERVRDLLHEKRWQDAAAASTLPLEAESTPTNASVSLQIMHAQALEGLGQDQEALAAYEKAFEQAGQLPLLALDTVDVLRLAGLRQSRLLRASGREQEAKACADRLKALLDAP